MDFKAVNWDVETDAKELDRSLFQENKKKKNSRKRKPNGEIESENSVVIKKKKRILEKTDEQKSCKVSNVGGNEQMSRKKRRDKKWQEKILKRKLMNEKNKGVHLNKTETGSELLKSPTEKKEKNKMQPGQNNEIQAETKLSGSRFQKRKMRWIEIKNQKKQRLEKSRSDYSKMSDVQSETHNQLDKVSKVESEKKVVNQCVTSKDINQMNKKERKKLRRKQTLKERKLNSQKMAENMNNSVEVFSHDRDHEKEKVFISQHEKSMILKNEKERKADQNCKNSANVTDKTDVKQVESPTIKKSRENAGSGGVDNMKKRKRVCKRNKFKGYVKPELGVTKESSEYSKTELEKTSLADKSLKDESKDSNFSSSTILDVVKEAKNCNKKNQKKKHSNVVSNTVKPHSGDKMPDNKGRKKLALDPKKLKALLSSDSPMKVSDVENEPDKTASLNMEKKIEKKPKTLLQKSKERLNAARFRYLNEQLYTTTGKEAFEMFKNDKVAFSVYHEGFQGQVEKWPTNPIDVIIEKIQAKPKKLILADFGCGDAKLARSIPNKVHSFDLVALNDHVTVCDMSKVPLMDGTIDIAVFCLSLMGTNLTSYLKEANRVIKHSGTLMIAEVTSRFGNPRSFVLNVEKMGFKLKQMDNSNNMFVMIEFKKTANLKEGPPEDIQLKPCLYKKR